VFHRKGQLALVQLLARNATSVLALHLWNIFLQTTKPENSTEDGIFQMNAELLLLGPDSMSEGSVKTVAWRLLPSRVNEAERIGRRRR
jgi:hypothetical protein